MGFRERNVKKFSFRGIKLDEVSSTLLELSMSGSSYFDKTGLPSVCV